MKWMHRWALRNGYVEVAPIVHALRAEDSAYGDPPFSDRFFQGWNAALTLAERILKEGQA